MLLYIPRKKMRPLEGGYCIDSCWIWATLWKFPCKPAARHLRQRFSRVVALRKVTSHTPGIVHQLLFSRMMNAAILFILLMKSTSCLAGLCNIHLLLFSGIQIQQIQRHLPVEILERKIQASTRMDIQSQENLHFSKAFWVGIPWVNYHTWVLWILRPSSFLGKSQCFLVNSPSSWHLGIELHRAMEGWITIYTQITQVLTAELWTWKSPVCLLKGNIRDSK